MADTPAATATEEAREEVLNSCRPSTSGFNPLATCSNGKPCRGCARTAAPQSPPIVPSPAACAGKPQPRNTPATHHHNAR